MMVLAFWWYYFPPVGRQRTHWRWYCGEPVSWRERWRRNRWRQGGQSCRHRWHFPPSGGFLAEIVELRCHFTPKITDPPGLPSPSQEQPSFDKSQFAAHMKRYINSLAPKLEQEKQQKFKQHVDGATSYLQSKLDDLKMWAPRCPLISTIFKSEPVDFSLLETALSARACTRTGAWCSPTARKVPPTPRSCTWPTVWRRSNAERARREPSQDPRVIL